MQNIFLFKNCFFLRMLFFLSVLSSRMVFSQEGPLPEKPAEPTLDQLMLESTIVLPAISPEVVKQTCKKYEGKVISYYEDLYKVKNCVRVPVASADLSDRKKIESVEADVIRIIPETTVKTPIKSATCKDLENQYVFLETETFEQDIYLVQGCKLKRFVDWMNFLDHQTAHSRVGSKIFELKRSQLKQFPLAGDLKPTIKPIEYDPIGDTKEITLLPIDEACKGVKDRVVSYLDRIYYISQNCRKRLYESDLFMQENHAKGDVIARELTSDQWVSLPDGEDMPDAKIP